MSMKKKRNLKKNNTIYEESGTLRALPTTNKEQKNDKTKNDKTIG